MAIILSFNSFGFSLLVLFFREFFFELFKLQTISFHFLFTFDSFVLFCCTNYFTFPNCACFIAIQCETTPYFIAWWFNLSILAFAIYFYFLTTQFFIFTWSGMTNVDTTMPTRILKKKKEQHILISILQSFNRYPINLHFWCNDFRNSNVFLDLRQFSLGHHRLYWIQSICNRFD